MKVYTRRGDDGTTGLLYGGRVDKDDLRTAAYGTVDEANSALGLARAALQEPDQHEWRDAVLRIQRELFALGAQLATHTDHWGRLEEGVSRVGDAMVDRLEQEIDALCARYPLPQEFVVPGQDPAGAAVDLARTIIRRAERHAVGMRREGLLPDDSVVRYLNRVSDYLFVLARSIERGVYTRTRET